MAAEEGDLLSVAIVSNPALQTVAIMATISIVAWGLEPSDPDSVRILAASRPIEEEWWKLLTANYAHLNTGHFTSNAIFVLLVGGLVSFSTSAIRFHVFFIVTGVISTAVQLAAIEYVGGSILYIVGSSGAAFALGGYLVASLIHRVSSGRVSISNIGAITLLLIIASGLTIRFTPQGAAILSHFVGALVGAVAGWFRLLHTGDKNNNPEAI